MATKTPDSPETKPVPFHEVIVKVPHSTTRIDDLSPTCLATRMGSFTRLAMLAFGLGPILGGVVAVVVGLAGGYALLVVSEALGWLSYPLLLPFFMFAAVLVYGLLDLNNPRLTSGFKLLWFVGFVAAGPIAIPAYWWIHVWRAPRLEPEARA